MYYLTKRREEVNVSVKLKGYQTVEEIIEELNKLNCFKNYNKDYYTEAINNLDKNTYCSLDNGRNIYFITKDKSWYAGDTIEVEDIIKNKYLLISDKNINILSTDSRKISKKYYGVDIPLHLNAANEDDKIVFPYISYSKMIEMYVDDMILCNDIIKMCYNKDIYVELVNGNDYNEEEDYYEDIYQYYIINENAAEHLIENTSEIIYYIEDLNLYVLGITHFGTSWKIVKSEMYIKKVEDIKEEEAKEIAILYQGMERSLYYSEVSEFDDIFEYLGNKYNLIEEFKENGIL